MAGTAPPPTSVGVVLNLFIAAAGAGLLSYPFASSQQGIVSNILSTLICAYINVFTDRVLVSTAALFRSSPSLQSRTFDGLAGATLGPRAERAVAATVLLGTAGGLIGFLIVIGDLLESPIRTVTGCTAALNGVCFFASRAFLIPAVALCVALPISSLRALSSMGHSSLLGAITVLAVGGVVAAAGIQAISHDSLAVVGVTQSSRSSDAGNVIVMARASLAPFFVGVPISIFSLGNHCQVVPAFLESPRGGSAASNFARSIYVAVCACVLLYLTTGTLGYIAFRSKTEGDVLLNLPQTPATDVAKVLLAIHVALAFPVLIFPARETLVGAAAAAAPTLAAAAAGAERGSLRAALLSFTAATARVASASPVPVAAALTAVAAIFAVVCPQISVVFGLVGATCATAQIHAFPGALLLRWADALESAAPRRVLAGGDASTWATAKAADAPKDGDAQDRDSVPLLPAPSSEAPRFGDDAGGDEPALRYLSSNPTVLRVQGYMLLIGSVFVLVLGTGSYAAQVFFGI